MPRQRVRLRVPPAAAVALALVVLLALALVYYGAMTILLAAKVSPHTVNEISAYRTIYDTLAGLGPVTGSERAIIAASGIVVAILAAYLAVKAIPRPYLTRRQLELDQQGRGHTVVEPHTIERIAEAAANGHPAISASRGRYAPGELAVDLTVSQADALPDTLAGVQHRVADAIEAHHLPGVPVSVTLAGYDPPKRRELG
jgi:hypothetical protein